MTTMWVWLPIVTLSAALCVGSAGAQTQDENWKRCASGSDEARVDGCTAYIKSGRASGRDLAVAHYTRAAAYVGRSLYDEAIRDYSEVIRLLPGEAAAWNGRCWARAIVDKLDGALRDCNEALRLGPPDAEFFDSRGFVHLKANRLDAAIADFDAALKLDPRKAHALYGRGIARRRKGEASAGDADVAAARAIQADVGRQYARHGVAR